MHRDVKPSNILINSQGQIKLCDFGISGYLVKSAAKTYIGSMPYMAPERVALNRPEIYTTQADVWSLEATLVELIMGRPLYAVAGFDSAFGHLMAIGTERASPIPLGRCTPAMTKLIWSLLGSNPSDRPKLSEILQDPLIRAVAELGLDEINRQVRAWMADILPTVPNILEITRRDLDNVT
jgi:mitogen-activated protein kinase kinase